MGRGSSFPLPPRKARDTKALPTRGVSESSEASYARRSRMVRFTPFSEAMEMRSAWCDTNEWREWGGEAVRSTPERSVDLKTSRHLSERRARGCQSSPRACVRGARRRALRPPRAARAACPVPRGVWVDRRQRAHGARWTDDRTVPDLPKRNEMKCAN